MTARYHWIITAETRDRRSTVDGTATFQPGTARGEVFATIRQSMADRMGVTVSQLVVLFFDVQPETMP